MLNVTDKLFVLNVDMLSVIMLNVVMLSVVTPYCKLDFSKYIYKFVYNFTGILQKINHFLISE